MLKGIGFVFFCAMGPWRLQGRSQGAALELFSCHLEDLGRHFGPQRDPKASQNLTVVARIDIKNENGVQDDVSKKHVFFMLS